MTELTRRLALTQTTSGNASAQAILKRLIRLPRRTNSLEQDALADVIQLIAVALRGGVGYFEALEWVSVRCSGAIRVELETMMQMVKLGDSPAISLMQYESSSQIPALRELALKLALADQLGSPVADQLEELAASLSAAQRAELGAAGSAKENQILLPLVFLVLPITVVFAIYPSLQFLSFTTL